MIETERQSDFLQKSLWRRGGWPEQRNDPAPNLLLVGELLLRFRHQTFALKSEGSINSHLLQCGQRQRQPSKSCKTLTNLASSHSFTSVKPKPSTASNPEPQLHSKAGHPLSEQLLLQTEGTRPCVGIVQHRAARFPSIQSFSFSQGFLDVRVYT